MRYTPLWTRTEGVRAARRRWPAHPWSPPELLRTLLSRIADTDLHRCTGARKTVENLPLRANSWNARHDGESPRFAWQAVSRSRLAALPTSSRASEEPTGIGRSEAATNGPGDVHYLAPNAAARYDDALTPISRLWCHAFARLQTSAASRLATPYDLAVTICAGARPARRFAPPAATLEATFSLRAEGPT
jgi:hypothetical protein